MGKQRKNNKETTVSDVEKKDEQLPDAIEQTGEANGPDDRDVGQEPGTEGPVGEASADEGDGETEGQDDSDFGEEPAPETVTSLAQLATANDKPAFVEPKSDEADAIINYIREYVVKMDPSKYNDAKTGVPAQARLYRMIVALMKLEFTSFKSGMDQLLSLIHEYRAAAFNDIYSRRFFENLYPTLTHAQVREFDDLLNVLVTVGVSSNRSRAMTQIDLAAALKSVKDAKSHQNMSAYFSALR
ncbi:hypothetical protein ACSA002_2920 [Salmonella phage vB_SalM_SA002]|nr:hypothetical protein ACSA002_2920 [Salmonella phage vB_SalM_SA002]